MERRPIRADADYRAALREVENLWEAEPGTPEYDLVEVLIALIEACEAQHHPVPLSDPIEATIFMVKQRSGPARRDREPAIRACLGPPVPQA